MESAVTAIETPAVNHSDKITLPASNGNDFNSTTSRELLWKYSFNVINRNPILGVGTGDLRTELNAEYLSNGWKYGVEKE